MNHPDLTTIGGRIRLARQTARLTQEAMADVAGTNVRRLAEIEHNRVMAKADEIAAIAATCGVTTDWLLIGDDSPATKRQDALVKMMAARIDAIHATVAQLEAERETLEALIDLARMPVGSAAMEGRA